MQYMIKRWNFQPAPEPEPVKKPARKRKQVKPKAEPEPEAPPCEACRDKRKKKHTCKEHRADKQGDAPVAEDVWLTDGHPWLGRKVQREFDGDVYVGTIISWLPENAEKDPPLWKLQHSDGDLEDLEEEEVKAGAQLVEQSALASGDAAGVAGGRCLDGEPAATSSVGGQAVGMPWCHRIAPTYCGDGCAGCGVDNDDENMLICESCESEWHMYCLKPALSAIPDEDWFCPSCTVARSCSSSGGGAGGGGAGGGGACLLGTGTGRALPEGGLVRFAGPTLSG